MPKTNQALTILPTKTAKPERNFIHRNPNITRQLISDVCDHLDKMVTSQLVNIMDSIGCTNAKAQAGDLGDVSMLDLECYHGTLKAGKDITVYFYAGGMQCFESKSGNSSGFELTEGTVCEWVADTILYQYSTGDESGLDAIGLLYD